MMKLMDSKFLEQHMRHYIEEEIFPGLAELADGGGQWRPRNDLRAIVFSSVHLAAFGTNIDKASEHAKQLLECINVVGSTFTAMIMLIKVVPVDWLARVLMHALLPDFYRKTALSRQIMAASIDEYRARKEIPDEDDGTIAAGMLKARRLGKLAEKEMLADLFTCFAGGTHTTMTILEYCVLQAAKNPQAQSRVFRELVAVFGASASLEDVVLRKFKQLHVLKAFFHETIRLSGEEFTLDRVAQQDVRVGDVVVPAGTCVVANVYHYHMSPDHWGRDAAGFRLDRWLDADGKFVKNVAFWGFGGGRRDCPGRALAERELFLVLACLFMKFEFVAPNGDLSAFHVPVEGFQMVKELGVEVKRRG